MDLQEFLTALPGDEPSGPDLRLDPAFVALERDARGRPGEQFGDTIIEAQEPEWARVAADAQALLTRSRDLRVAMLWLRAAARTRGFAGFADGVALIQGLLVSLWGSVHPQLDAEDNDDPTMRLNALAGLADPAVVLADLRAARLGPARGAATLQVRKLELGLGKAEAFPGEDMLTEEGARAALVQALAEAPELAAQMRAADAAVAAIATLLDEKAGAGRAPNLQGLRRLTAMLAELAGAQADAAGEAPHAAASAGVRSAAGAAAAGAISSREDALRALDRVCDWLTRAEPSNPAPLLIRRAQRLMQMDFLEIVRDIAPESVDQVMRLVGNADH